MNKENRKVNIKRTAIVMAAALFVFCILLSGVSIFSHHGHGCDYETQPYTQPCAICVSIEKSQSLFGGALVGFGAIVAIVQLFSLILVSFIFLHIALKTPITLKARMNN